MHSLCNNIIWFFIFSSVIFCGCSNEITKSNSTSEAPVKSFNINYPNGFDTLQIPDDNFLSEERIELGEKLFFDVILSKDSSISCSFCHKPELAFADTVSISPGINGKLGFRNAPSVFNVGYFSSFMLDGGVPTLEIQVVHPLTDTNEMGFGINEVVERLKSHPYYSKQSKKAYDRDLDAFVITRALSAYERTLLSGNSKYDLFKNGNTSALNESEKRGMDLFFSKKLNCSSCHSGFLFTNGKFENNGSKKDYSGDHGRERITHETEDIGKFKVPSLRNVSKTYPYMHDGSFADLKSVIENYNQGGSGHGNQSHLIHPLKLTTGEKTDLIQFLKAL